MLYLTYDILNSEVWWLKVANTERVPLQGAGVKDAPSEPLRLLFKPRIYSPLAK